MNIGIIGTGLMGLPLAQRLLAASYPLTAYNRTPEKLATLQAAGATIAPSPDAVIAATDGVVLMLTDAAAIREMVLSDRSRAQLPGKTILQMGTIAPSESRQLRDEIQAAGGEYLEAPVLGSIPEAKAGTLLVMVGSTPAQFQQWLPVLQCFGTEPRWLGDVGTAAATKLALNQLIGSLTTAFAMSLGFVQQQGVEVESFMEILRQSALYAPTFDKKLQRMRDRQYAHPNFPTKHLLKDTNLFVQEAETMGVDTAVGKAVQQILIRAVQDWADADYSALYDTVNPRPTTPADG